MPTNPYAVWAHDHFKLCLMFLNYQDIVTFGIFSGIFERHFHQFLRQRKLQIETYKRANGSYRKGKWKISMKSTNKM